PDQGFSPHKRPVFAERTPHPSRRRFAPSIHPLPQGERGNAPHPTSLNVTPQRSNVSPDTLQPFVLAASRTLATSAALNVNPLIKSLSPLTKRKLALGNFNSGSPPAPLPTAMPKIFPQCSASPCGSGLCISTSVSASGTSFRLAFCHSGPAGGYGPSTSSLPSVWLNSMKAARQSRGCSCTP